MSNEQSRNHPPSWALDAVAAGDPVAAVEAHLGVCEACARYVAVLREEAAAFRARSDPSAFAASIRARAGGRARGRTRSAIWLAGPVLAAAAWFALGPLQTPAARSPQGLAPGHPGASSEHFKGGLTIAVVRERAGRQERLTEPFEVEPGDRIRLEVAVDGDRPVEGGLLSADGSWAPLLAPVPLGPGTHYSELAARFDDAPTDAVLLVGAPADVDRARATRNFADVIAWRVTSAPRR